MKHLLFVLVILFVSLPAFSEELYITSIVSNNELKPGDYYLDIERHGLKKKILISYKETTDKRGGWASTMTISEPDKTRFTELSMHSNSEAVKFFDIYSIDKKTHCVSATIEKDAETKVVVDETLSSLDGAALSALYKQQMIRYTTQFKVILKKRKSFTVHHAESFSKLIEKFVINVMNMPTAS